MNFFRKNKEQFITFIACGTIFIVALSVIALLSGTIMRFFGFRYDSIGSMILFFIITTIVSYPMNLIAGGLSKALYQIKRINKNRAIVLYLILDTIATYLGLMIVDHCCLLFRQVIYPSSLCLFFSLYRELKISKIYKQIT